MASHAPILIEGNAGFTTANGVVGGSGTLADPFVIEGWQIDVSTANGVEVRNTTAPFVIRNMAMVRTNPNAPYNFAVLLANVTDGGIEAVSVGAGVSGLSVVKSTNVSVSHASFDPAALYGFSGFQSENLTVRDSNFAGTGLGADGTALRFVSNYASYIFVHGATDIVIDGNHLDYGGVRGSILMNTTDNALISRNVGVAEILTGWAGGGDNNTRVIGNNVSGGEFGIRAYYGAHITIAGNNVSSQSFAGLTVQGSSNVTIFGNRIANSAVGTYLHGIEDVLVAHNDFESNVLQADVADGQRIAWNDSYPAGGNHWSDYTGSDRCSGPHQDVCTGPDGIGDSPYTIDSTDEDFLPFMAAPLNPSPDTPPQASFSFSPESGNTSTVFRFDASSSWDAEDPGSALVVRWDWESDGIWDTNWSTTKIAWHQFTEPASYDVRLEVQDTAGLTGNASAKVDVTLPPAASLAASITASPTSGTMPLTVSFSSNVTGGTPPYQYQWEFGDGSTSNVANTVHIYLTGGNFPVWLNVNDHVGDSAQSNVLFVDVTPAVVNLTVTPPTQFNVSSSGIGVTFTATVTGGTPPYTYHWDFGDGTQSDQPSPSHMYAKDGIYIVSLTVTDARGQTATRTFDLTVPSQSVPPAGDFLTPFVLAIAIGAAAIFAALWWTERRRGRTPPKPPAS